MLVLSEESRALAASAVVLFSLVLLAFMLVVGVFVCLVFGRFMPGLAMRLLRMGRPFLLVLCGTFFTRWLGSGMGLHRGMGIFLLHRPNLSLFGLLAGLLCLLTFMRGLLLLLLSLIHI